MVDIPCQHLSGPPGEHPVLFRQHGVGLAKVGEVAVLGRFEVRSDPCRPDRSVLIVAKDVDVADAHRGLGRHRERAIDQQKLLATVVQKPPPSASLEMIGYRDSWLKHIET
jgi:hypothetical protein